MTMLCDTVKPGHVGATLALFALTLSLHGCGDLEKCPDMVPIANGKVKMKCGEDACNEEEVKCDSGCGFGLKSEDSGKQMQFSINTADNCVIKFTKEPPYCHKCENNGDTIAIDGGKLAIKEGAKAGSACNGFKFTCDDGKKGDLQTGAEYACEESSTTEAPCVFYVNFNDHNPCSSKTKVKTAKVKESPPKPKATENAPATTLADAGKLATGGEGTEKSEPKEAEKSEPKEAPKPDSFISVDQQIVSAGQKNALEAYPQHGEGIDNAIDDPRHSRKEIHHAVEAHPHHRKHEEDDDLPHLDQVRPWVLDAHAAAYLERH